MLSASSAGPRRVSDAPHRAPKNPHSGPGTVPVRVSVELRGAVRSTRRRTGNDPHQRTTKENRRPDRRADGARRAALAPSLKRQSQRPRLEAAQGERRALPGHKRAHPVGRRHRRRPRLAVLDDLPAGVVHRRAGAPRLRGVQGRPDRRPAHDVRAGGRPRQSRRTRCGLRSMVRAPRWVWLADNPLVRSAELPPRAWTDLPADCGRRPGRTPHIAPVAIYWILLFH